MFYKLFWIFRALLYKPFFRKFGFPSYLGKPIFIGGFKNISIGSNVRIFPGARIECVGDGVIVISDNVAIAQNIHITSAGHLTIGKDTTILQNVMITNIDHDYTEIGVHVLKQKCLLKETSIGENCFIGFGAVIQAGTKLGNQCIVGANSVVRGQFKDYSVIVGVPARVVKRFDIKSKLWKKTDHEGNFLNEFN